MIEGQEITAEARRWIGVRWRHQGRSFQQGVDCIGLCLKVAEKLGSDVPHMDNYARRQDGSALARTLASLLTSIDKTQWQQGDIALFQENGFPIHTGFLSLKDGRAMVIHAHARRRKVVEEALDMFGTPVAVFRLKEAR